MSIQTDAYQLCKTVWSSPSRDEVRDLISGINAPRDGIGADTDRSHFGYIARQLRAQVLGYLVVDRDRAKLQELPFAGEVPPLSVQEQRLLASVHKQIVQFNSQCLAPLTTQLPKCAIAVDPYNQFPYVIPPDIAEADILTPDATDMMASSFQEHPAIALALESAGPFADGMTEQSYAQQVVRLTDELLRAGVSSAPEDLALVVATQSQDSPSRLMARHLAALICARASLATLDQLIHQAILSDRLSLLNEDSIIEIRYRTKHLCGTGISVTYQPGELVGIEDLLTLLLIKCAPYSILTAHLCQVEAVHVEVSRDFGHTVQVELREIDHNLNPFGPLLDHL